MKRQFIKAAMLKTPEGIEFMAFFDLDGRIKSPDSALEFLHHLRLLTAFPVALSFKLDGQWRHLASDEHLTRFMMSMDGEARASLLLYAPILTIPGSKQTPR